MKTFAQLDAGVVHGMLQAVAAPAVVPVGRSFVDVTDRVVNMFDLYDAATDTFTPPSQPNYGNTVSPRDFLLLFTLAERKAIRAAARTDSDVEDVMHLAEASQSVRLKHPNTLASLGLLVSKGLLTEARKTEISNS